MLRNLFKVALRNIGKDRIYSVLNILGLTLGITCSLFLFLYLLNELSYDQFHTKKDRIYRVVTHFIESDNQFTWPSGQIPLAQELEENYPDVAHAVRFIGAGRELFANDERDVRFYEEDFYYVDSSVFEVFNFPLIAGDPTTALLAPNTAVVTQTTAEKYFGDADPIGQSFRNGDENYQITGLVEDVPSNSHLEFNALLSRASLPDELGGWGAGRADLPAVARNRQPGRRRTSIGRCQQKSGGPGFRRLPGHHQVLAATAGRYSSAV